VALLRRRTKVDIPHAGPYAPGWEVPAHFNFTRDVVDTLAADPARSALTFVDREGIVDRKTFHEISLRRTVSAWSCAKPRPIVRSDPSLRSAMTRNVEVDEMFMRDFLIGPEMM